MKRMKKANGVIETCKIKTKKLKLTSNSDPHRMKFKSKRDNVKVKEVSLKELQGF